MPTGRKGSHDKAIEDYNEVLRLAPNAASAYNGFAWLEATCPDSRYRDGKLAVINAKRVYELDGGKTGGFLDTLAAAYAESGDFDKAREWQSKVVEMAEEDKNATEKDKQEYRSRVDLYKQGKPYRDEKREQEKG